MMAYPSTWEVETQREKFHVSLGYMENSRPAWATRTLSKNKKFTLSYKIHILGDK